MPGPMTMRVSDTQEIARRFKDPKVRVKPFKTFLTDGTKDIQKHAKLNTKRRTGKLRRSIRRSIRRRKRVPMIGRVFTRVFYGRMLEYGTTFVNARLTFRRALNSIQSSMPRRLRKLERDLVKSLRGDHV